MARATAASSSAASGLPNSREMAGYQADMAAEYWGGLYDESRRDKFLGKPDPAAVAKVLKPADWNDYVIRCEGPRIRLWLNGLLTVDFTETDPAMAPHRPPWPADPHRRAVGGMV